MPKYKVNSGRFGTQTQTFAKGQEFESDETEFIKRGLETGRIVELTFDAPIIISEPDPEPEPKPELEPIKEPVPKPVPRKPAPKRSTKQKQQTPQKKSNPTPVKKEPEIIPIDLRNPTTDGKPKPVAKNEPVTFL